MKAFYDAVAALLPPQVDAHLFSANLSNPPQPAEYPYAVIWGTAPTEFSGDSPDDSSLCDMPDAVQLDMRLTIAALSPTQLDLAVRGIHAAINRVKPTVTGYQCNRIRLSSLLEAQPDRDLFIDGINPIYTVEEFQIQATKE